VEPRTRRFFSQYLFSFKLNPQTVIFAGYSDNSAAMPGNDLQQQNRTFFVKLGYAWAF
jgi:phage terminase small subunit